MLAVVWHRHSVEVHTVVQSDSESAAHLSVNIDPYIKK